MKKAISSILFFFIVFAAGATDFYSVRSGNAADLTNWNSKRDGTGHAPAGFGEASDNFIIQQQHIISAGKDGFYTHGSVVVETGGTFITGGKASHTRILTALAINPGATFRLQAGASLLTGFILVQGRLENLGGQLTTGSSPMVAAAQ